jgi:thiamine pyrophosphate-dependent acetolactate synthase large subunit-like protein
MRVVDAIAEILRREGVEFLSCYPTTIMIEAAAAIGIRPVLCRQERVGVDIADGYSRVSNGNRIGVFAMQYGPGAENAFPGIATAYSDSAPLLVLPLGHSRAQAGVFPNFRATRTYASVTKNVEDLLVPEQVGEAMRRAYSLLKNGRSGPVMLELPTDVASADPGEAWKAYRPVRAAKSAAAPRDVDDAARALVEAERPVIYAGQGTLYAEATDDLVELAELLQVPVATTLEGKSAFPEDHPLALGAAGTSLTGPGVRWIRDADLLLGVGAGLSRHGMYPVIPPGKTIVQITNDHRDFNKGYPTDHALLGDAKLVVRQLIGAVKDRVDTSRSADRTVQTALKQARDAWMSEWLPILTSDEKPITPYRVIWEAQRAIDAADTIVTHDSGSPRDQIVPMWVSKRPRGYIGWGKSHALGTGLGLIMGAKLAAPEKVCINFMGDAAFGMTGLDFETAVRNQIPIITVVLNNSTMAVEIPHLPISHEKYGSRDIGGSYADLARAMGGWSERVDDPAQIGEAFKRARRATEDGRAALLEFITSAETRFSMRRQLVDDPPSSH